MNELVTGCKVNKCPLVEHGEKMKVLLGIPTTIGELKEMLLPFDDDCELVIGAYGLDFETSWTVSYYNEDGHGQIIIGDEESF